MASFRELLADAKSKIKEVDTQTAATKIDANQAVVLDVREPDEFEQGALLGVVAILRHRLKPKLLIKPHQ
jgi:rhodanese-related sulfurtransferase